MINFKAQKNPALVVVIAPFSEAHKEVEGQETHLVDGGSQLSVSLQIHVGAGVDGILVLVLPELQREQGVLAPGNVLLDVDLLLVVRQVGVTFAADGTNVDLRTAEKMTNLT